MDDRPALLPAPGVSLLYQPDGTWAAKLGGYAQFTQEAPSWSGPGPDPSTALVAETTHFRVPGHKTRSRTVGYLCMGCHGTWVDEDGAGRCPHCTARAHGSEQYQIAARAADERRAEQASEVRHAELGRELWSERKRRLVERIAATASEVDARNERERVEADAEQAALKARAMFGDRYGFRTSADHDGEAAARRLAHRNAATPCRHAVTDNVTTSLGRVLLCCDCGMHLEVPCHVRMREVRRLVNVGDHLAINGEGFVVMAIDWVRGGLMLAPQHNRYDRSDLRRRGMTIQEFCEKKIAASAPYAGNLLPPRAK